MNKLSKILNYIYAPLIKMVNRINTKPTINIKERSFFSKILVFSFLISFIGVFLSLISFIGTISSIISIFSIYEGASIIKDIYTAITLYFEFGFAYYYDINFKTFAIYLIKQLIDLVLSLIIFSFCLGILLEIELSETILSNILIFISGILCVIAISYCSWRLLKIFFYNFFFVYPRDYLTKYHNDDTQSID